MNVLIVDDEIVQIETLGRGLRTRGYGVCFALNGEDALEKLYDETRTIDMVITDYAMPEMNGLSLLKRIRKRDQSLPVIMMTAYADKALVIAALRNRCESFIEKPFTLDQLIREIERASVHRPEESDTRGLSDRIPKHLHQINNPLMSIVGSAELAMKKLKDPDAIGRYINRIIGSAEKISEINESLMKKDQISIPDRGIVDLKRLLQGCLKMFRDLLALKEISVEAHLPENVRVRGDRFGLEQVFKNVILNAVDAMDGDDTKRLCIQTAIDSIENTVRIQVMDTGCGIAEPIMEKLFTPYVTNKAHGNGLGLAVVKNIVEDHQGAVSAQSRENKGTIFTVSLPLDTTCTKPSDTRPVSPVRNSTSTRP
jgi:signal transduction histidine kinase